MIDTAGMDTNLYRVAPGHLITGPDEWIENRPRPPEVLRELYASGHIDIDGLELKLDLWFQSSAGSSGGS